MERNSKLGLAGIILGGVLGNVAAAPPSASVNLADSQLFPGQSSSCEVKVDTLGFPYDIIAASFYFDTLPPSIHLDDTNFYDAFTGSGTFTEGFFEGYPVNYTTTRINHTNGAVGTKINPSYPREKHDKVIRYNFDVPLDTEPGVYMISLNLVNLTKMIPFPASHPIEGSDLTPGQFEVIYNAYFDVARSDGNGGSELNKDGKINEHDYLLFRDCASGPSVPSPPGCEWADGDNDGDIDQSDFGTFQICMSGDDYVNSTANPDCLRVPIL